jgi:hypothetical protein
MNSLKRIAGILWMVFGVLAIYLMFNQAIVEFGKNPALDTRIFWYTIVPVFSPIMIGMVLFGYYCLKGEYDQLEA